MTWTPSDVRRIARLARLDLPPDALPRFAEALGDVLAWIERIDRVTLLDAADDSIDTEQATAREADDVPAPTDLSDLASGGALRRAPAQRNGFFLAPES